MTLDAGAGDDAADSGAPLAPDPAVIRGHLERLFRRPRVEYPGGLAEIAWSDAKGAVNQAESYPITPEGLDRATITAARYNAAGRNLYVGVNPRKPTSPPFGRASAEDVAIAFCLFIDGDSAETAAKLRAPPLPYTWAVTTGRVPNPRPQAYWDLDEPTRNLAAWSEQQRALAEYFGADHVIDPPRIMRLAGTINYPSPKKAARGYIVEQVTIRTRYDGEERQPVSFHAAHQAYASGRANGAAPNGHDAAGQPGESRPNFGTGATGRVDPQECIANINAGVNLHNNARGLINLLVATGHRDWLIRDYLTLLLKPVSDGGTIAEIGELIRSGRRKWDIPNPPDEDFDAPPPALTPFDPTTLDGAPVPERQWLVRNWIPMKRVTALYGRGGEGKTILAQMLATATALGKPWLGIPVERGNSLLLFCEDDLDEMHRRQQDINRHYECDWADLSGMLWLPRLGHDNALMTFDRRPIRTALFDQLLAAAKDHDAKLIIVDTLADEFAGNENDRNQARAFAQAALGLLARETDGAVLNLAHPSRAGMSSGSGESGSTGWLGAFRSVLYMTTPKDDDDQPPEDPDRRDLSRIKANFARRDETIQLRWQEGVFVPIQSSTGILGSIERRTCERVFMELLDKMTDENQPVSANPRAGNYAPRMFLTRPERQGFKKPDFVRAMQALFSAGNIVAKPYGRPGDMRTRIARPAEGPAEAATEPAAEAATGGPAEGLAEAATDAADEGPAERAAEDTSK